MKEPIGIDAQFQNYLTRVKLDKNKITLTQYDETKKAFFAGASSMLVLFRNEIPELSDKEAILAIEKLFQEASFYWSINLY